MRKSLLIPLILILTSIVYGEPLKTEVFGFKFGMTIKEARSNVKLNGYQIIINDSLLPLPQPSDSYCDLITPIQIMSNNPDHYGFKKVCIMHCEDPKDETRALHLSFAEDKLFEIQRHWQAPTWMTNAGQETLNKLIKLYGNPNNAMERNGNWGFGPISTNYLWTDNKVAMLLILNPSTTINNNNSEIPILSIQLNYLDLKLTKYLQDKELEYIKKAKEEELRERQKYNPKY